MNLAEGFSLAKKPTATSGTQIRLDFYTTACPRKSRPVRWPGPRLPTLAYFRISAERHHHFTFWRYSLHFMILRNSAASARLFTYLFVCFFFGRHSHRRSANIVFLFFYQRAWAGLRVNESLDTPWAVDICFLDAFRICTSNLYY